MSSETLNPNLENSPNSTPEFEFWFFFQFIVLQKKMNLEISPNSRVEFGEFSKLRKNFF